MKYILLSVLVALVLVSSPVLAEKITQTTYSAELTPVEASVYPGERATYNLVIDEFTDGSRYQLTTIDPQWIIDTNPTLSNTINGKNVFEVEVQPVSDISFGPKIFELRLTNIDQNSVVTFNVPINIKNPSETPGVYVPSVQLEIDMEREIDPREQFLLEVDLINRNNRILDPLLIQIDGKLFAKEFQTSLGGLKQRNQEVQFSIDPLTPPGAHKALVKVVFENKTIAEKERSFRVLGYNELKEDITKKHRLLDVIYELSVTNDGNQEIEYDYNLQINWFSRLFLSASEDFSVNKIDGLRTATITDIIDPQDTITKTYVVHWNYLALIILTIVFSLLAYYKLRNPVISMKEILLESADKNISEAKVRIFVRNRSNKTLNNMRVVDKLPGIADLVKTERLGTLQPSKITKTKSKGTILKWEINTLEPYEERIITYKIKSRLEIVGGLSLPPAKIIFEEKEGKEREAFSNEAKL